jgi:hypothetical protein
VWYTKGMENWKEIEGFSNTYEEAKAARDAKVATL